MFNARPCVRHLQFLPKSTLNQSKITEYPGFLQEVIGKRTEGKAYMVVTLGYWQSLKSSIFPYCV